MIASSWHRPTRYLPPSAGPCSRQSARPSARSLAHRRAAGFTLIEVLIAIVIVAVGLLGLPALQLVTLKSADGSRHRASAIALTQDMADRLRANSAGSVLGVTVNKGYNRPRSLRSDEAYNSPKAGCRSVGCPPEEMVLDDLAGWQARINQTLPGGIGVVCIDSGTLGMPTFNGTTLTARCDGLGGAYAIKVLWLDNRDPSAAASNTAEAYTAFVTRINPTF